MCALIQLWPEQGVDMLLVSALGPDKVQLLPLCLFNHKPISLRITSVLAPSPLLCTSLGPCQDPNQYLLTVE